jgi:hypothetical protein
MHCRAGVIASGYRAAAPGGPTVSAVEVLTGSIAASGTGTPTITTSLASTDMVVVVLLKSTTSGTPGVSGLGTWTNLQAGTGTRDHYIWTMTGVTGGGSITITPNGPASDYVVYVLRRSDAAAVTAFGSGKIDNSFISTNTQISVADINSATAGMFVIGVASPGAATLTFPHANMLPASGWTTDFNGSNSIVRFLSQTMSANSTVRVAASSSAGVGTSWALLAAVFQ